MEWIALVLLYIGIFFCGVGVYGLIRFPDVYTRLHASGKVATLGLAFILLGASLLMPELSLRALLLIGFILLTAPVATHAIASSAHRSLGRLPENQRDDLFVDENRSPVPESSQTSPDRKPTS
jgi:multicomponent Na+:H+ antiporter subunit G